MIVETYLKSNFRNRQTAFFQQARRSFQPDIPDHFHGCEIRYRFYFPVEISTAQSDFPTNFVYTEIGFGNVFPHHFHIFIHKHIVDRLHFNPDIFQRKTFIINGLHPSPPRQ